MRGMECFGLVPICEVSYNGYWTMVNLKNSEKYREKKFNKTKYLVPILRCSNQHF